MNEIKDKDLREALRLREEKRRQPQVPTDFCNDIMRKIGEERLHASHHQRRRIVAIAMAVAASLTLLFLFAWQRPEKEKNINEVKIAKTIIPPKETKRQEKKTSQPIYSRQSLPKRVAQKVSHQHVHQPTIDVQMAESPIDSLQYYIDKIERELAHVDESLYIERMNQVIQADDRLQRIVNQFILNRITSDEKPQTVLSTNPQNQEDNEE